MRGVIAVIVVIFFVSATMLVGVAALEPVGEEVKQYDIDQGGVDGTSTINTTYDVVFKIVPMIAIGGISLFAVAYYLRREQRIGRRR